MRHPQQGRFRQQVNFLRRQFLQEGKLPFTEVLSANGISQALEAVKVCWNDRIFSPLVTLWVSPEGTLFETMRAFFGVADLTQPAFAS